MKPWKWDELQINKTIVWNQKKKTKEDDSVTIYKKQRTVLNERFQIEIW